jgi:uncharacterized membrane protein YfcA
MDASPAALALVAVASVAAGVVNAVAGGGTLLVLPTLNLAGLATVDAGITTTTALTPGYLGGTLAQRADLAGQRARAVALVPVAAAGGLSGALLLTRTSEGLFRAIIPWLVFGACGLLAAQDRIRAGLDRRRARRAGGVAAARSGVGPVLPAAVFVGAVYGGYFGGGLGIILLAVLGLVLDDDLRRLNALKQGLSLVINVSAALLLIGTGRVPWAAAGVVAAGSLAGGVTGGRLASHLDPRLLRRAVVVVGVVVGLAYLMRR